MISGVILFKCNLFSIFFWLQRNAVVELMDILKTLLALTAYFITLFQVRPLLWVKMLQGYFWLYVTMMDFANSFVRLCHKIESSPFLYPAGDLPTWVSLQSVNLSRLNPGQWAIAFCITPWGSLWNPGPLLRLPNNNSFCLTRWYFYTLDIFAVLMRFASPFKGIEGFVVKKRNRVWA